MDSDKIVFVLNFCRLVAVIKNRMAIDQAY